MTQYEGNPVFPKDFYILDASSPPIASTWIVGYQALGDRTAYLLRSLAMRIAAFDPQVEFSSLLSVGTDRTGHPGWSAKRQRWYVTKPQEAFYSECYGVLWSSQTSSLQPDSAYHVAFINDSGNARYGNGLFIPRAGNAVQYGYTDSTSTYAGSTALPSNGWGGVLHDPTNDVWVIYQTGKLYAAPTATPTVWTSVALPGGGTMFPVRPVTDGTTWMMQGKSKGLYTTTDWLVATELTTAFGAIAISGLVYDAWRERFVAYVAGAPSEVWASEDAGASWTKIAAAAPFGYVHNIVSLGPILVGVQLDLNVPFDLQHLVYSADGGVTWGRAPSPVRGLIDSDVYLISNGSDICAVGLGSNYKGISFSRGWVPMSL